MKIEGENTFRAPKIPNLNEMVKMRGRKLRLCYYSRNSSKMLVFNSFFQACIYISNNFDGAIEQAVRSSREYSANGEINTCDYYHEQVYVKFKLVKK